jgi:flagellar protein FliS
MDNVTARIVNANPTQLIEISYEIILKSLDTAKEHIKAGNEKDLLRSVEQAQKILRDLMDSLDMSYPISLELMSMYLYINKAIIQGWIGKNADKFDEAQKLLRTLLTGWNEVAAADKSSAPAMANTQQVYAGLTYGKGSLNESVVNDKNRGFKA